LGWRGEVDGPFAVAQFDTDFYQAGGLVISPDEKTLYLTDRMAVRKIDLTNGVVSTVAPPELEGFGHRGIAMGASGNVYISGWQDSFVVLAPDGTAERRPLDRSAWTDVNSGPPGYIAVDEDRGWVYGLERNRMSGALYRWPIEGGAAEWLNSSATGGRTPEQYLSDGPVENLEMANPGGISTDSLGYVYIGAGDGLTFRRYSPDSGTVESLCVAEGAELEEGRFEWCIGDNARNRIFGTWPLVLAFDAAGNGYFGYTVWPRLVRLRREL
jgi:hypothetical protein